MLFLSDCSKIELSVSLSSFLGCSYSKVWCSGAILTLCLRFISSFPLGKLSFFRILFFKHSSYFSSSFRHLIYVISFGTSQTASYFIRVCLSFSLCRLSSQMFSLRPVSLLWFRLGVIKLVVFLSFKFRMEMIFSSLSSLLGIYSQWIIYSIWNILLVAEFTVFKSTS